MISIRASDHNITSNSLLCGAVVVGAGVVVVGSLQGGHSPFSRVCHCPPGMHITPNILSQVAPGRYVLLGLFAHL